MQIVSVVAMISSFLLTDTVDVVSKNLVDGEEVPITETVTNVRFDYDDTPVAVEGLDGLIQAKAVLWIDLKKSNYSSLDIFNAGTTIIFDGADYNVKGRAKRNTRNSIIHHWEVVLV